MCYKEKKRLCPTHSVHCHPPRLPALGFSSTRECRPIMPTSIAQRHGRRKQRGLETLVTNISKHERKKKSHVRRERAPSKISSVDEHSDQVWVGAIPSSPHPTSPLSIWALQWEARGNSGTENLLLRCTRTPLGMSYSRWPLQRDLVVFCRRCSICQARTT